MANRTLYDSCESAISVCNNSRYRLQLSKIPEHIAGGGRLSEIMKKCSIFPVIDYGIIGASERSGTLQQSFNDLADKHEKGYELSIVSLSAAIEPFLLIISAGIVGTIALAVLLPMYKIIGSLK